MTQTLGKYRLLFSIDVEAFGQAAGRADQSKTSSRSKSHQHLVSHSTECYKQASWNPKMTTKIKIKIKK